MLDRASDARVLVLDPEAHDEVAGLARELGATHVVSGFVPPPFVAGLLTRWIALAQRHIERDGWSRTSFPETETEPWGWLADLLGDPQRLRRNPRRPSPEARWRRRHRRRAISPRRSRSSLRRIHNLATMLCCAVRLTKDMT